RFLRFRFNADHGSWRDLGAGEESTWKGKPPRTVCRVDEFGQHPHAGSHIQQQSMPGMEWSRILDQNTRARKRLSTRGLYSNISMARFSHFGFIRDQSL